MWTTLTQATDTEKSRRKSSFRCVSCSAGLATWPGALSAPCSCSKLILVGFARMRCKSPYFISFEPSENAWNALTHAAWVCRGDVDESAGVQKARRDSQMQNFESAFRAWTRFEECKLALLMHVSGRLRYVRFDTFPWYELRLLYELLHRSFTTSNIPAENIIIFTFLWVVDERNKYTYSLFAGTEISSLISSTYFFLPISIPQGLY